MQNMLGHSPRIQRRHLLPAEVPAAVQPASTPLPPIINLRPQRLFDEIVGEYFFATLENAAMQSFFSENSDPLSRDGSRASEHPEQVRRFHKTDATPPPGFRNH